jgi:hypothetical protein
MRVELPLLPQLKETLGAGPTGDLAFIVPAWHAVEQRRAGHRVRGSGLLVEVAGMTARMKS